MVTLVRGSAAIKHDQYCTTIGPLGSRNSALWEDSTGMFTPRAMGHAECGRREHRVASTAGVGVDDSDPR